MAQALALNFNVSFQKISNVLPKQKLPIIPNNRVRYLSEIVDTHKEINAKIEEQELLIRKLYNISCLLEVDEGDLFQVLKNKSEDLLKKIDPEYIKIINEWKGLKKTYTKDVYTYFVRGKKHQQELYYESLSGNKIPKIAVPDYSDWGDIIRWVSKENFPGYFPYTAGVFPLKRTNEDPTRMFAGEGTPERTNRRFHFVSRGHKAKRLSTAFDSITLYGENPSKRPDIYGKIGNSGVSIATLDDAKRLYSGFDLADPTTSVSMTINGPAPMLLSFFLNTAIDQQCEKYITEHNLIDRVNELKQQKCNAAKVPLPTYYDDLPEGHNLLGTLLIGITGDEVLEPKIYEQIKNETLVKVRGTVQADILKEDQAQNTCIFSTDFALTLMGDIQEYFIHKNVRNFYSVSVSGYHIAEAGANPISQLAFTLSNGFTYVEYYLSRGMHIDDFAPNLSFFFSNGIDPEYAVIGRVARRIWAKAIKYKYGGNERSQKLKYHIQTSGRSLHASEIAFNDIRTTLQALYAIYDNCNSLHTNAYDEAITTPTEESVRRALAIQLIINNELGQAKNENPLQGSFIIHELTDLVEEAVMQEFERISDRGGVLAAMDRGYQRSKIQEESMIYEAQKLSGELPIIGVNTFLDDSGIQKKQVTPVSRSTKEGKDRCITNVIAFEKLNFNKSNKNLNQIKTDILKGLNSFDSLLEAGKTCSLGQITNTLYELGGKYRRNM